jgi:hypothetical protein
VVDTLKDPLGTLRARCVAAAEPGADRGVEGVGIADGANRLEDLGEIIDDQGNAFESGCDICELVRGEEVVDRVVRVRGWEGSMMAKFQRTVSANVRTGAMPSLLETAWRGIARALGIKMEPVRWWICGGVEWT